MRTYITTLLLATTLGLMSCGGGNDVASSGATAVSAAASTSTTTPTEPKVNGQIDERTGVAPVVAAMTIAQTVTACEASAAFGGTGPLVIDVLNPTQQSNPTLQQCWDALPGYAWGLPWVVTLYGGCARSSSFGGSEPALTLAQKSACITAVDKAENLEQCFSLGGKSWTAGKEGGV